ncbi:MAG: hypothetical protein IKO41_18555 [Lachnospiraceae bacterium]|nr:hypothetical protein [Lachnospiraceae bacterium]
MINTIELVKQRKEEINQYLKLIQDIDSSLINTQYNSLIVKIMKSNLILMLYNLVEATLQSSFSEIYVKIKEENCKYSVLTDQLRAVWLNQKVLNCQKELRNKNIFINIKTIVEHIIFDKSTNFNKSFFNFEGNVDNQVYYELCKKHGIKFVGTSHSNDLKYVKDIRNKLAHGDNSFGDCLREKSLNDIKDIKCNVFNYIDNFLDKIRDYYDNKKFIIQKINPKS